MKRLCLVLLASLFSLSLAVADTSVLAYWAQNDNDLPGGGFGFTPDSFPQPADVGTGNLSLANFDQTVDADGAYACIASFGGSTLNAQPGFASGGSLSPQGCDETSNNGMQILIAVDTSGFEAIEVSWVQRGTATGFSSRQFAWSADGGQTFTDLGSDSGSLGNSFQLRAYDLAQASALNDNPDAVFRITLDGATNANGNNRFDNITVTGTVLGSGPGPGPDPLVCVDDPANDTEVTRLHAVQGAGSSSPIAGQMVEVQAVVVGAFQDSANFQIGGFFLQEPDDRVDNDPMTSEGLFISQASASFSVPAVAIGDEVRVRGQVREQFGQTELFQLSDLVLCAPDQLDRVSPVEVSFPVDDLAELEAVEGMWVRLPQAMAVTEVFGAARFAEFTVAPNRLFQPTQVVEPGQAANALQDLNDRSRLIIDQGLTGAYRTPYQPGLDGSPLNAANPIRAGFRLQANFDGVMGFGFSNYRLFALQPAEFDDSESPRLEAPPALANADLRVGSYNVENLFTTLQTGGVGCGPNGLSCRGATSASELERQRDKLVSAISALDADVLGLIEIENDDDDSTLAFLVNALNAVDTVGDWAFIATGFKGTDAIKNAIIYRAGQVTPVGDFAVLDSNTPVIPPIDTSRQRPVLAQTFETLTGDRFTLSVVHFRSKNCGTNASGANTDQGDGQGCWNALRTESTQSMLAWLDDDPTGSGSDRHLVVGDFNAYAQEDPMQVLVEAGYVNQAIRFNDDDPEVYSFIFQGQSGSLDHIMASPAMNAQVVDAVKWSINADEIPAFAYPETLPNSSLPKPADFYQPDPFRSSDHDPVLIGVEFFRADRLFSDRFEQASDPR
ncbi:MAG: ExeM/NucH family extracellular endonuclease [Wenzhouxiangella sp.]